MTSTEDEAECECSSSVVIIVTKFLLFLCNLIVWLLGVGILALGIYIQVDDSSATIQQALTNIGSFLTNPSVSLIVVGAVLFIIGFCGCFGALLEVYILLILYSIFLIIVVLGEIALVVYVVLEQDQAYSSFESILRQDIEQYYDDINVREVVDIIQRDLLKCCGISSPDDWQANIYYNCSSPAHQRCSVPASCCLLKEGQVVNLQCGYRTLDATGGRFLIGIHTTGCIAQARDFVNSNTHIIIGAGCGLLVFQVLGVVMSLSLAAGVKKEKDYAKILKKRHAINNSKLNYENTQF